MNWLRRIAFSLRKFFASARSDDELDDELAFHLEMSVAQKMNAGMSEAEARATARREFGNLASTKEECRVSWGVGIANDLLQDIRFGLRQINRSRIFALVTILTLALCIGANTAAYILIDTFLLNPFDYPRSDRVVNIGMQWRKGANANMVTQISTVSYLEIEEAATSYEALGLLDLTDKVDLRMGGHAARLRVGKVTPGLWQVAGVMPFKGRFFTENDLNSGRENVVVLSYALWKQLYSRDDPVIGSEIQLDDRTFEVIGVMPRNFAFGFYESSLWIPRVFSARERGQKSRGNNIYAIMGRLRDGVSPHQAQLELEAVFQNYLEHYPEKRDSANRAGTTYGLILSRNVISNQVPAVRLMLFSVQGIVAFIMGIGCLNIAGLMLARANTRRNELGIRLALGAGRFRLVRQFVTETVLLFLIALSLGLPLAALASRLLCELLIAQAPVQVAPGIHGNIVFFGLMLSLVFGVFTGVVPVLYILKGSSNRTLSPGNGRTTGSSGKHGLQGALVVFQVALAVFLLTGAVLMIASVRYLLRKPYGFAWDNRFVVQVDLPNYRYDDAGTRLNSFKEEALKRLQALPGVSGATFVNRVPLYSDNISMSSFSVDGYELAEGERQPHGVWYRVPPGYFQAMEIPLLKGRGFDQSDTPDSPHVVIVGEQLARDYFGERDPLGASLTFWGKECIIVGIAANIVNMPLFMEEPRQTLYFPYTQWDTSWAGTAFVLETGLSLPVVTGMVRETLLDIDPMLVGFEVMPYEDILDYSIILQKMPMGILSGFTLIALVLAAMGIYGSLAYLVTERTREIGVRMALGARRFEVLGMILARGLKLAGMGLVIGLIGSIMIWKYLESIFYGVKPADPLVYLLAAVVFIGIALFASLLPACRATRINPITALHYE